MSSSEVNPIVFLLKEYNLTGNPAIFLIILEFLPWMCYILYMKGNFEIEVEFGMKMDVKAGAIIASTGVEANFKVKLKWKRE